MHISINSNIDTIPIIFFIISSFGAKVSDALDLQINGAANVSDAHALQIIGFGPGLPCRPASDAHGDPHSPGNILYLYSESRSLK